MVDESINVLLVNLKLKKATALGNDLSAAGPWI